MQILFNGKVGLHRDNTAIAIEGNQITAVGSNAEVLALETPTTKKINLGGKCIWPGLIDSHLHLEWYSLSLQSVDCETATIEECLENIASKAHTLPENAWIQGRGWNQNVWQNGFGNARQLDAVSFGHPAFLNDKSLHSAWVNSLALKLSGIDRNTPDPVGGTIQRHQNGDPTGILFENAVQLVQSRIPAPTSNDRERYLRSGQEQLIRFGLTGVTDFDGITSYESLCQLQENGHLQLRITKGIPFDHFDWAIENKVASGKKEGRIRWGALKLFSDGALGPQTAAMFFPYNGSTNNYGKLQLTADEIFEIGKKATDHGISLAIHAIGDKATHEVLQGYAKLREYERSQSLPLLRHRIEHLQLLHPDNLQKCVEMGLTASMQPIHATSDMYIADKYWGTRAHFAYAFQTLLQLGTHLIFGSDAPVESPNPFLGIHAAVTRRRPDGSPSPEGWQPQEKINLAEAIDAYSVFPAMLDNDPVRKGELVTGQVADLIVLEKDPFQLDPQEIFNIQPESVMINGEWVFRK